MDTPEYYFLVFQVRGAMTHRVGLGGTTTGLHEYCSDDVSYWVGGKKTNFGSKNEHSKTAPGRGASTAKAAPGKVDKSSGRQA